MGVLLINNVPSMKPGWSAGPLNASILEDKADTWWRHHMETFSVLLALCAGNSPFTCEFPSQRPVTRSFDFFYLRLKKRLSKQSWGWWFGTPSRSLRRHCNGVILSMYQTEYINATILPRSWYCSWGDGNGNVLIIRRLWHAKLTLYDTLSSPMRTRLFIYFNNLLYLTHGKSCNGVPLKLYTRMWNHFLVKQ